MDPENTLDICFDKLEIKDLNIEEDCRNVLTVDIGIKHLGLCLATIYSDYSIKNIVDFNLVDITEYTHNNCKKSECTLQHTKTCYDWMEHIFIEHPCFNQADIILIERQPIVGGIVVIEQLIFGKYRNKSHLINPRNVHRFLKLDGLTYDQRKFFSIDFGLKYLSKEQAEELKKYERAHDITDAIEMLVYWTSKKHEEKIVEKETSKTVEKFKTGLELLESYRYIPLTASDK